MSIVLIIHTFDLDNGYVGIYYTRIRRILY